MNTAIYEYLKTASDLAPDSYDGSYELVRAVVTAYKEVKSAVLNYLDLNAVYLMCIGTWRHSYEKKKETLRKSHLPKEEQENLCALVDRLKTNAENGYYSCKGSYVGTEDDIGMFGTGFYSFQNKTNDRSVREFIRLCIDLLDLSDDEQMFQRAALVLNHTFKGMQTAAASVVLHCLKPDTFPVLNSNAGKESTFAALDIPLEKPGVLETYIGNCRKIKAFRDQNFPFKNYRIMDMVPWEMGDKTDPIKRLLQDYKNDFENWIPEELYKWQAVKCFQDHWKLDAENFSGMLESSLKQAKNLLDNGYGLPMRMIIRFAEQEPETVREMFWALFTEETELTQRIEIFQQSAEELLIRGGFKAENKRHFQSDKNILRYLFFHYPERYYLYQYGKLAEVSKLIGYDADCKEGDSQNIDTYMDMAEQIRNEVERDKELLSMLRKKLTADCYQDQAHHLLTDDIIFYGYCQQKKKKEKPPKERGKMDFAKNMILYGPPGTGKTYHTVLYAVAILEGKRLDEVKAEDYQQVFQRYKTYKKQNRIAFTTFHQSYGYEDFIEGIRPKMKAQAEGEEEAESMTYQVEAGVFKWFCEQASRPVSVNTQDYALNENPTIWKVSLEGTGPNETRAECLNNDHIRIGWDGYGENFSEETEFKDGGARILNAFYNRMRVGDIVFSCYSASQIDAIGVVTGAPEWDDRYAHYKRVRPVKWLAKDFLEDIQGINGGHAMVQGTVYQLWNVSSEDTYRLIEKYGRQSERVQDIPYVFIIDEINRGNISKIFGELITLIEENKRIGGEEETLVSLPYSRKPFGVPKNVTILGTMNTADRSIAMLDTALRRRFQFREMLPEPDVLAGVEIESDGKTIVVSELLRTMNRRIEFLYDREHTIGHAYFMPLKKDNSMDTLGEIFSNSVIPLLQEYFFEDYEKIRMVLGDNQKTAGSRTEFIMVRDDDMQKLFGHSELELDDRRCYEINRTAAYQAEAYNFLKED